ncbi:unnamed protein product [Prunus armeniaca]
MAFGFAEMEMGVMATEMGSGLLGCAMGFGGEQRWFCDGKGMGSSMVVVNLMGCAMGCVCKRREFSMGCGWISDRVGFDFRWGLSEREGGFWWVVREWGS